MARKHTINYAVWIVIAWDINIHGGRLNKNDIDVVTVMKHNHSPTHSNISVWIKFCINKQYMAALYNYLAVTLYHSDRAAPSLLSSLESTTNTTACFTCVVIIY